MTQTIDTPQQDEKTFTFKRSHFYAVMVVLAFAAGVLVGYVAWGRVEAPTQVVAVPTQQQQPSEDVEDSVPAPTQAVRRYDIPTEGFPSLGPEDAPITIVEFTDYQCPFCKRWHDEVYPQLMETYPRQIRLVMRSLPLTTIHPEALPASQAALCAGEQNSYWTFQNLLFGDFPLGQDTYTQYATQLGLDLDAFQKCISEDTYVDFIQQDMDFSLNLGVRSTPTFFINGLAVVGAQPFEVFKDVIDKELAGEIP